MPRASIPVLRFKLDASLIVHARHQGRFDHHREAAIVGDGCIPVRAHPQCQIDVDILGIIS